MRVEADFEPFGKYQRPIKQVKGKLAILNGV
jgi:hypothetical protein